MSVSERDRRHFSAIAAAMAAEKEEQREEAALAPAPLGMAVGFLLGAVPLDAAAQRELDRRGIEQIGLARRRPARRT